MFKRIPQAFINELLTKADIVSVIERYVPLKKSGSNYTALCPFHNEKSPSFSVSPTKQFFYCFGCGASGNAIGFIMDYERIEFVEAIENLAHQLGLQMPTLDTHVNPDYQALLEILVKTEQFYCQQLANHPQAKKAQHYLIQRGLSATTIQRFGLGYAAPGWDNLLKAFPKHAELLLKAGLLIENENQRTYDRFRERIIFPIRDRRGRTIGFGGRVLDNSLPKYLNSPETIVFHKGQELYGFYEARQANPNLERLLVVEGYMDVISLAEHGINYAVATLGTAITSNNLRRLLSTCKQIIFCFDGDLAGQKAAWKALEIALPLLNEQTQVNFCFLPVTEDPDSYIRKHGQANFIAQLEKAISLSEHFFEHLCAQINLETLEGRVKLIAMAMPYLQTITATITKELLIAELAKISHTPLEKITTWSQIAPVNTPSIGKSKTQNFSARQSPIRYAISLILQYPQATSHLKATLPEANLPGLPLLQRLLDLTQTNPNINTGTIIEHWRDQPEVEFLIKLASVELITPEGGVIIELEDTLKHINKLVIDNKIEYFLNKARLSALSSEEKQELQSLLNAKNAGF